MPAPTSVDPQVNIAVLFERLGHVVAAVNSLSDKIDRMTSQQDQELRDLDERIRKVESQIASARWFMFGVAAGGGALGGGVAAAVASMLGAG